MIKSLIGAAAVAACLASTVAYAQSAPAGVKTASVNGHEIFVDAKGMTLYSFDNDKTPGKSSCNDRCATNWPPLAADAKAKAKGSWTIITRDDGSKQWAYKGMPLYTFIRDTAAGEAKGDNVGPNDTHVWHVVAAK